MIGKTVIVLGGGSAGLMAAIALRAKVSGLAVRVIRSPAIGIIGVGEGSTVAFTRFLHEYLQVGMKRFHEVARPTWKLGLKFLWGSRPSFNFTFGPGYDARVSDLPRPIGFYCDGDLEHTDAYSSLMTCDRAFERGAGGGPVFQPLVSYHVENENLVRYLEGYAIAAGVTIVDDTVTDVRRDAAGGVAGLVRASGAVEAGDLYVDASGFRSELLGRTLGEPFVPYAGSLFCDRAVVGGWARGADEPIRPYTTCETMEAGWAWQIEHEERVNRGYVYSSAFATDEEAEREFRQKNPKVEGTRVVRFVAGRYRNTWVGNVVAIGNASGFVEPLEATALGVIAMQSRLLADTLAESGGAIRPTQVALFNAHGARHWDSVRNFLAVHYKFNRRVDTPFWRHCWAETDLAGAAGVVEYYQENGPSAYWEPTLLDPLDFAKMPGYVALLLGQRVPHRASHAASEGEARRVAALRQRNRLAGQRGMSVRETLDVIRSSKWRWA